MKLYTCFSNYRNIFKLLNYSYFMIIIAEELNIRSISLVPPNIANAHLFTNIYCICYRTVIFLCMLILFFHFGEAATLHGAIYDSSYNLLQDVRLDINTTPKQSHISKNGLYFFYVPVGTYEIVVEKYYQKQLAYTAKEIIMVDKDGEFNIDIIVQKMPGVEIIPEKEEIKPSLPGWLQSRFGNLFYVTFGILAILVGTIIFLILRLVLKSRKYILPEKQEAIIVNEEKKENVPKTDEVGKIEDIGNPEEILNIIKQEGGRTTQKLIRKKIPLSEAKISLMISELEAKGKIEKIKKGRGNLIILKG